MSKMDYPDYTPPFVGRKKTGPRYRQFHLVEPRKPIPGSITRPMGKRMIGIILLARERETGGKAFPTERQIIEHLKINVTVTDVESSLESLCVRGLIEPIGQKYRGMRIVPETWKLTPLGWAYEVGK